MNAHVTRTTITATELQRNFGGYFERAAVQAITVVRHKRARIVMVPADEYADLVKIRSRILEQEPLNAVLNARFTEDQALAPECPDDFDDAGDAAADAETTRPTVAAAA